ncbi:MAG: hypothetical protein J5J00_06515 [Deltaproteobacteria bacterium]|nr:hypothetical protein [Deltaproteobacteria bacterium]
MQGVQPLFPQFVEAGSSSLLAFYLLLFLMFAALAYAARRIDKSEVTTAPRRFGKVSSGVVVFVFIFSVIVAAGLPGVYYFPTVPLLFGAIISLCIWFSFSRYGAALGQAFSLQTLVAFQGFRIPLEFILRDWGETGTVPLVMSWAGQNYDVISGIAALVFAPLIPKKKSLAWIPTVIGALLLVNVLRIVLMSSPFPFSWQLERPLQLILHLPYALIVPLCVVPALIGHLVVIRVMLRGAK